MTKSLPAPKSGPTPSGEPAARAELSFPFHTNTLFEPPEMFGSLRETPGLTRVVLPTGDHAWLATRYEDVRAVLAEPRLSRAAAAAPEAPRLGPMRPEKNSIMAMDPPEHTRLRKLVVSAFTTGRIEAMSGRIQQFVDELLDGIVEQGPPADFVSGLSRPLPMLVICELLGVPGADRDTFMSWADSSLRLGAGLTDEVVAAREALAGYLAELIEAKRANPVDDLLSKLVLTAEDGDRLSQSELVALGTTLLTAGFHPVSNVLANSMLALLSNPPQLEMLLRQSELMRTAVEELLRYTPGPVSGGTIRVATEDLFLGGTLVRAGEAVIPATTSANRDGSIFFEPDRLDLTRQENPHVAFGPGVHHCLGAALARAQVTIALRTVLRRLRGVALAVDTKELTWTQGTMIRGLTALPLTWETVT